MTHGVPEWLNEEFLAEVLSSDGEAVAVTGFTVTLAVAPGNNYTSDMWRVQVDFQSQHPDAKSKKISLMVKSPIAKGIMSEMADKCDLFSKEPKVYSELLPLIADKTGKQFGPKYFPWPRATQETRGLILQDLKEEGYVMAERQRQLDFEHCSVALTSLAQFHAASVACVHDHPHFPDHIGNEVMYQKGAMFESLQLWFKQVFQCFSNRIAALSDCVEESAYVRSRLDFLADSTLEIVQPKPGTLNVLGHGDFWTNNMLFKYNKSGEIIDLKLIDFQMMRYATPVLDVLYFIWSSANHDVRENRLNELLKLYLDNLNTNLQTLGCTERLGDDEFHDEIKNSSDFALLTISTLLPLTLCESENAVDMEQVSEEDMKNDTPDERWMKVYSGENFTQCLPGAMKQFYKFNCL